jgi:hypothetical protein
MRKPRSSFKLQDVQRAVNSRKFRVTGQFPVSVNQALWITAELPVTPWTPWAR